MYRSDIPRALRPQISRFVLVAVVSFDVSFLRNVRRLERRRCWSYTELLQRPVAKGPVSVVAEPLGVGYPLMRLVHVIPSPPRTPNKSGAVHETRSSSP